MPRSLAFVLVLLLATATQGCLFAPGQQLSTWSVKREGSRENSMVELVPITPKLLAIQDAARRAEQLPVELTTYRPGPYLVGVGDILNITVWDHPELTAPAGPQQAPFANGRLVRPDGNLFYPYIGEVQAAGRTIEDLRSDIAERLTRYIESPQVDVAVIHFGGRKVTLTGAFDKTGIQALTTVPLTLPAAVGEAGIDTAEADLAGLILKRDGREYRLDLDALNRGGARLDSIYLKDGDQLHLPYNDRKRVFILGEVVSPGPLHYKTRSISLSEVIGAVSGLRQETSAPKAVYVIRGIEDLKTRKATVFQLDAKSPTAMVLAAHFEMQPQDVVFVGAAPITRWNRFISQVVPSFYFVNTGVNLQRNIMER